jgi:ubiquinone/menaquinone biosynthesis C-methylase UbiE
MSRTITVSIFLASGLFQCIFANYATRETAYDRDFTQAIEIAYGDGYLASGGKQTVERLLKDIKLDGAMFLDFGCGVGGPALYLAQKYSVSITAVDVEPYVISVAQTEKKKVKDALMGSVEFQLIQAEQPLPLDSNQFDVIYASETILHVQNKEQLFSEFHRVLRPNGKLIINDWLHSSADYSNEMQAFVQADGLTFHLITLKEYADLLTAAKFNNVIMQNSSQYTLNETQFILQKLNGPLGDAVRNKYDEAYLQAYKDSWLLQKLVFDREEMLTYVIYATK